MCERSREELVASKRSDRPLKLVTCYRNHGLKMIKEKCCTGFPSIPADDCVELQQEFVMFIKSVVKVNY